MRQKITYSLLFLFFCSSLLAQHSKRDLDNEALRAMVAKYKKDVRGPYVRLNWYCDDGTVNPAKEPCGDDVGGVQRATYKDEVIEVAE